MRIYLRDLPPDHELRNKPLLGAWYHYTGQTFSREVLPSFGIAKSTYNRLADAWTNNSEFYFNVTDSA
jgi:hypothetical protein